MKLKNLVFLLIAVSFFGIPVNSMAAKDSVEIIFSENFEGDLSRWRIDGEKAVEKISLTEYRLTENDFYSEYISQYLSIVDDTMHGTVYIKSPVMEVESMKDYTVALDVRGEANLKLYIVFLKDNGETYADVPDVVELPRSRQWQCTSVTATVPYQVTKMQLYLAREQMIFGGGGASFDNVVVCKGRIGFNKELEKRSKYAPTANNSSNDFWSDDNIVFYDTFEGGLDKWEYDTKASEKQLKALKENSYTGIKSLKIITEPSQKSFGIHSKDISVIPNSEYEVIYDFVNSSGDAPHVYMRFYDEGGKQVHSINVSATDKNWNTQKNSVVAPENAKTARVCIYSGSKTGASYVDNIKVVLTKIGQIKDTKYEDTVNNSIVLFIGSPNALVNGKKTFVDETNHSVVADIVNSRTLVPVRFIAENYRAEVLWDEVSRTVTLNLPSKTAKIVLDKKEIDVSGNVVPIDVPAQVIEGRTMLPLRAFVEEVMGKNVFWDDRGLIVITDTPLLDKEDTDIIKKLIDNINQM